MTYRERALAVAMGQLGVTEHPPGSNTGPQVNRYLASAGLVPGYPWCMAFVHWCYRQAGLVLDYPNRASVGFFEEWATSHGYLVTRPARGDLVCYRFDADNWPDHVGIVISAADQYITTVEGNTAVGNDGNGGKVMERRRRISRCKFVRIPGGAPDKPDRPGSTLPGPRVKPKWFWAAMREFLRRRRTRPSKGDR